MDQMRGINQLILNQATIVEAVQEYFDKRMNPKIEIVSIRPDNGQFQVGTKEDTRTIESIETIEDSLGTLQVDNTRTRCR